MDSFVEEGNKLSTAISLATEQQERLQQKQSVLFVRKLLEGYITLSRKFPVLQPEIMAFLDEVEV
jgi:hypothetical protein